MPKDCAAITSTSNRRGLDEFIRTSLIVPQNKTQSFDLVDDEGNFICRINASHFGDGGRANVDVIFGTKAEARTLTWKEGMPTQNNVPDTANLVAVDFKRATETGSDWER